MAGAVGGDAAIEGRRPHVVIVGGGFGGLAAAKALDGAPVDVTLIDKRNHHLFQPLLYQVATAGLSPADIAGSIRAILARQKNVRVLLDRVYGVDQASRRVILGDGEPLAYDWLILATGATHSYFGRDDWAPFAPGVKTIDDATAIRRRVLLALERAETETDEDKRKALLTFVVIGGGPTGVEMAGAIAELARQSVSMDFRHITPHCSRILLLQRGDRVLQSFPPALSEKARKRHRSARRRSAARCGCDAYRCRWRGCRRRADRCRDNDLGCRRHGQPRGGMAGLQE
jgi:NADH:ubiquinone reductase (H+-translocating)